MPSIRYANQSAPFWDFIANLENQGASHPFSADQNRDGGEAPDDNGPWGWGWPHRGWHRGPPPFGSMPFHPPPGPHYGPEGPAPSHPPENEAGTPGEQDGTDRAQQNEESGHERRHRGPHGPHGHGFRGRGGRRGGFGRGRWGAWGPPGGPFNMNNLSEFIQSQMFGQNEGEERAEDFKPEVDVFDTEAEFVVHVSLPGAKKEDIAVGWDAEKSELSISGVVYRPGDEEFLKTLAMDERKVGAFERKVRLGSRANPAQVLEDGITAKLEEGILRVEVPKMNEKEYVEVKKIDID
ncbi:HSP20-like chaperone [Rhizodiscina lignyota]|uniref:HSP20-like chaperone n=1 Tax=Rhizodiscina lignyota TaxID=1504668 RepID=A0A9P4IRC1_9PEZI|nr:HSP20-like chaperone [Rhizodiscina lignyota]